MATISSAGIGSGLDVNSIVTQLVALERRPIEQLQGATAKLQTQLSSVGKLQSALATLRDAAAKLTRSDSWSAAKATSTDAVVASATAGASSLPGHYAVSVTSLAAAQTLLGGTHPSAASTLGSGTLTIQLGTWGAGQGSFTPKAGTTAVAIPIAPGAGTLEQVRDAINAAGAGVTASIVNDASGARLAIRSRETGEAHAFRIQVADDDGNSTDAAGLSALAYDPSSGVASMTRKLAAANARATINGVEVVSTSNTLPDVIDGLTVRLGRESAQPVDIEVASDQEAIGQSIRDFVGAWNALNTLMREQTAYDAASRTAGVLQGDRSVIGLQSQLRTMLGGSSGASSVYTRLADIGFDLQRDGSIALDDRKLGSALNRLDDLKALFSASDALAPANDGFATRIKRHADGVLGVEGALAARKQGLSDRISRNGDREAALEGRVAQIEKRLRAQYTALDAQMARLTGLSNYVTQQVSLLNRSDRSN